MQILNKEINGYKFTDFINKWWFWSVYKAEKWGESHAIKMFDEAYVLKEYKIHWSKNNRLIQEIEIMQMVDHENLVKYIDHFEHTDETWKKYFLVMEYIEGENLRYLLKDWSLEEDKAVDIFKQILNWVWYLHDINWITDNKGIIHRDLKPENIIITKSGKIKIVDFWISKVIDFTSITNTWDVFGTWPYMSPEQVTDSKHIDKRSDLYTVWVILYEMLTWLFPYDFQFQAELLNKIKEEPAIPPRRRKLDISNKLENITLKLLEKNPYDRFMKASEVIWVLEAKGEAIVLREYDLSPKFYLRLYDDKSVLEEYLKLNSNKFNVIFPANLETQQKNLLSIIQKDGNVNVVVDPATVRLAYDTHTEVKWLCNLPYAPDDWSVVTPSYLDTHKKQQEYVKKVIDKQVDLGTDILLPPFHYQHNSNVAYNPISNPIQEWFDLDCKLAKESIDYRDANFKDKDIYVWICIKAESLIDPKNKKYLLNTFSSFDSDGYLVYADGIDYNTKEVTLHNYIDFMISLQKSTWKPVIAWRVNTALWLGLLSFGVSW